MHDDHATMSQLMFRMPENLHEQLEEQASANHRSLNAEVVARLQASLGAGISGEMPAKLRRMESTTDA
jgi:plasmid stability protein